MITIETLHKLIDHYDEIIKIAQSFGFVNLRLFYDYGNDHEKDILHFVGVANNIQDDNCWKRDINEELEAVLGVKIRFLGEDTLAITRGNLREGEKAPLSDMHKVIDYFADTLIPYSMDMEEELDAQQCQALYARWEQKKGKTSQLGLLSSSDVQKAPSPNVGAGIEKQGDAQKTPPPPRKGS